MMSDQPNLEEQFFQEALGIDSLPGRREFVERALGVAFGAEQKHRVKRRVTLKIIKLGMDSKQGVARFEAERQALALMDRPNITTAHDPGGHGVFVNGRQIEKESELKEGDVLRIGDTDLLFTDKDFEDSESALHYYKKVGEGETLGQYLRREPMTVTEAMDCCKQIAEAPTITHMTTVPGELLGTAPYMSPEQARARPVDKRSDIWSFGCVLYECLTGKRMFHGEDVTETLASIIKGEPDWDALPEDTPPTVELLLRKCLNKDRKRRLHDIADARIDIEQALGDPSSSIMRLSDGALRETKAKSKGSRLLAVGSMVVYNLYDQGAGFLRRNLVTGEDAPIRGVADALEGYPFLSWDGNRLGCVLGDKLVTIPISGGTPRSLVSGLAYYTFLGADWSEDGDIWILDNRGQDFNQLRPLVTDDALDGTPLWSPDRVPGDRSLSRTGVASDPDGLKPVIGSSTSGDRPSFPCHSPSRKAHLFLKRRTKSSHFHKLPLIGSGPFPGKGHGS